MKLLSFIFAICISISGASAYQMSSSNEYGTGDARNQNITVKCTTPTGHISTETCSLRRYAKCNGTDCSGWKEWRDLRNTTTTYSDWQSAADACCRAKGLR